MIRANWLIFAACVMAVCVCLTTAAPADTWDITGGYSGTRNPNGSWSAGRKWSPDGASFDLFTHQWGPHNGWYMGNVGHGGPSMQAPPVIMWAKNNTNGLPAMRWTCPESDLYTIDCTFTGWDSRGVGVNVFVVVNNSTLFTDNIDAHLETASYQSADLDLAAGDVVDFMIQWDGSVYYETSWTKLHGSIETVPEPATMGLLALGGLALMRRRRR